MRYLAQKCNHCLPPLFNQLCNPLRRASPPWASVSPSDLSDILNSLISLRTSFKTRAEVSTPSSLHSPSHLPFFDLSIISIYIKYLHEEPHQPFLASVFIGIALMASQWFAGEGAALHWKVKNMLFKFSFSSAFAKSPGTADVAHPYLPIGPTL